MKFLAKTISLSLALTLLFSACKKEELSSSQWGELAEAKRKEMLALSTNIPCNQKQNVTVQTLQLNCSMQFFPVLSADLQKYEKLKKEYLAFVSKQFEAFNKEGLIVELCFESLWATDQQIRIDCKDDKVQLITAENLPVEEAKSMIPTVKSQIDNLIAALNCTNNANWSFTRLINHQTMSFDYIPYAATSDYKELKAKVSLYNRLNLNVIKAEQKGSTFTNIKTVEKIECENGKPVIKFTN